MRKSRKRSSDGRSQNQNIEDNGPPEIYKCCENPQITYLAPVNINVDEKTIGTVDVWRCAVCKKKFCEEKQLGIESIN